MSSFLLWELVKLDSLVTFITLLSNYKYFEYMSQYKLLVFYTVVDSTTKFTSHMSYGLLHWKNQFSVEVIIFSDWSTKWLYAWNAVRSGFYKFSNFTICVDKKRNLTIGCFVGFSDWAYWGGHTGQRHLCRTWLSLLIRRWEPMSKLSC